MNLQKLRTVLPPDIYNELVTILNKRTISKNQPCHLLANCDHESGGWKRYEENLNYRPKRLLEVFPKYFKNLADATAVVKQGVIAIADRVYSGRMGNKKGTVDAYNFRGSGPLQITGRNNFTAFDATVPESVINNPHYLRTKYKLQSAFWFFDVNKIWVKAINDNLAAITSVRKTVNGGTNGLSEVTKLFKKYSNLL